MGGCASSHALMRWQGGSQGRNKEVFILASLKQLAYKLQTALCQQGRYIKINHYQSYSQRQERMVTKYVLQETRIINGKNKAVTILESYQLADIVKKLASLYGGDAD